MPKETDEEEVQLSELSEIEVDTLGLVEAGANRLSFFLMKSEEATMPEQDNNTASDSDAPPADETQTKEVSESVVKSLIEKFLPSLFQEQVEKEKTSAKQDGEEDEEDDGDSATPKETTQKAGAEQQAIRAIVDARVAEIQKAAQAEAAQMKTELAKARAELDAERERRERQEWVEKARSVVGLSLDADDLAKRLHALEKSDGDAAEWLLKLLQATGEQMRDANLFREVGTAEIAKTQADLVEKAQEMVTGGHAGDVKEALLKLDPADAHRYLNQRQRDITGKGGGE